MMPFLTNRKKGGNSVFSIGINSDIQECSQTIICETKNIYVPDKYLKNQLKLY